MTVASAPKLSKPQMGALYKRAQAAGLKAGREAVPAPMVVGTPADLMGSLLGKDGGGFRSDRPVYYVSEGVCGFGWVSVNPGTSRFARWLVSGGLARKDSYAGGVSISSPRELGQSLARNEAWAYGFAEVLREVGIKAWGQSRID